MFTVPRDPFADGLLAGIGILVAAAYALRRAPAHALAQDVVLRTLVAAILGGMLGGHALHVAVHGGAWLHFWREQSVFGVLAGGALAAALYLRVRRQPLLPHADLAAPGVAAGYAVARIGCLLHGDDFGITTTRFGVHYLPHTEPWLTHVERGWIPPDAATSLPVVPVQLALALCALAIFALLARATLSRGAAVGAAALMYGVARLLLDPLRDDYLPLAGSVSLPQLAALLLAAAGASLIVHALLPRMHASPASVHR